MNYRLVVTSITRYLTKYNGRKLSRISAVASGICNGQDSRHSGDDIQAPSELVYPLSLILIY
jgi:hypothetical protein